MIEAFLLFKLFLDRFDIFPQGCDLSPAVIFFWEVGRGIDTCVRPRSNEVGLFICIDGLLNYHFLPQALDLFGELLLHLKASFFLVLRELVDFFPDDQDLVADIEKLLAEN